MTWVAAFGLLWKIILSSLAGDAKADAACVTDECLVEGDLMDVLDSGAAEEAKPEV